MKLSKALILILAATIPGLTVVGFLTTPAYAGVSDNWEPYLDTGGGLMVSLSEVNSPLLLEPRTRFRFRFQEKDFFTGFELYAGYIVNPGSYLNSFHTAGGLSVGYQPESGVVKMWGGLTLFDNTSSGKSRQVDISSNASVKAGFEVSPQGSPAYGVEFAFRTLSFDSPAKKVSYPTFDTLLFVSFPIHLGGKKVLDDEE